jgi:hypothetical protein
MMAIQDTTHGTSGGAAHGLAAIGLRPVAGHIGAGITHVGIARPLPAEQVDAMLVAGKPFTSKHTVVVAD